ncbi:MAG: EAL domain-containing protein [Pyrinomonadaceae bacterium]
MKAIRKLDFFIWTIIVVGIGVCGFALYLLPYSRIDIRFALLAIFTIFFASRLSLKMPGSGLYFLMSDALIFLTFLIYGGEAAILLAAAEAICFSLKTRWQGVVVEFPIILFNGALMACATAGAYGAFAIYPRLSGTLPDYNNITELISLLGLMTLSQFSVNSTLAAIYHSLKTNNSIWQAWNEKCLGASITSIIGAVVAGVMFKLIEYFGSFAFIIVGLIVALIYFTYLRYIGELKKSMEQAEQAEQERLQAERRRVEEAEQHISELSSHIAEQDRISEALRQSKERFQHAALHDALTSLPNRTFFFEQIKFLLERSRHNFNNGFCVLFMDLDKFKNINDSLGHAIGDKLLVKVARRLEKAVRQGDTVARLGGDEFALVLTEVKDVEGAISFAQRIHQTISEPFKIDGHQVFTAPSIGIAIGSTEYETPEEILRDADIAMYNAKERKMGCALFDRELRVRTVNTIQLETDLRYALEKDQFRVFYQPIISLESGHLAGFEALIRWLHPERGMISPMEFIPIAESNGQIVPMTNWILAEACGQLSRWRWRSAANRSLIISVNLSSKHFTQPDLVEQVKLTLHETGLDPRCLKLELTESAVMENAEVATQALHRLRQLGVQLSIDDFGTGYSSLSYLHKFPIDTLKIDRSFISRMGVGGENTEIVRTILTLAENLGLDVIAEGVETVDQLEKLRQFGCPYAQGFLFAKPMPQNEIDEKMKSLQNWLPDGVLPLASNIPISRSTGKLITLPKSLK